MLEKNQKVKVEFIGKEKDTTLNDVSKNVTNPITNLSDDTDKIKTMVTGILDKELPLLKNNTLLHELVLYTVMEKVKTVQTVENVLSYIKEKNVKEINDVRFENGEVCIKCSI